MDGDGNGYATKSFHSLCLEILGGDVNVSAYRKTLLVLYIVNLLSISNIKIKQVMETVGASNVLIGLCAEPVRVEGI